MANRQKWTSYEIKKLLACKKDEDFMHKFPNQKIGSLQRKQRYFRQNGNPTLKPPKPPKNHKEEFIEKETQKEFNRLFAKRTFFEVIGEELLKATKSLPLPKIEKFPIRLGKKQDEEEMCLVQSDHHIGLTVDSQESGGLGSYNFNIFKEEMQFLKTSLAKIFGIHFHNTPYKVMNIFALGDIVESRTLRPSQLRLTDLNICQQIMSAVDELAVFLAWLCEVFPIVNFYGVVGQHGRFDIDKSMHSPRDNMDYLIYHWLKERLKNYVDAGRIKFHISDSWYMLVERMGVKFYLEHGDEFFSWLGIPFYGLKRGRANIRELMRQYLDEKGRQVDFDYFLTAHIHQPSDFNDIITNGSFPGGDEYSLKKLKAGIPASQKLFSIHPVFKKTWSRDILLKTPSKKPIVKFYN